MTKVRDIYPTHQRRIYSAPISWVDNSSSFHPNPNYTNDKTIFEYILLKILDIHSESEIIDKLLGLLFQPVFKLGFFHLKYDDFIPMSRQRKTRLVDIIFNALNEQYRNSTALYKLLLSNKYLKLSAKQTIDIIDRIPPHQERTIVCPGQAAVDQLFEYVNELYYKSDNIEEAMLLALRLAEEDRTTWLSVVIFSEKVMDEAKIDISDREKILAIIKDPQYKSPDAGDTHGYTERINQNAAYLTVMHTRLRKMEDQKLKSIESSINELWEMKNQFLSGSIGDIEPIVSEVKNKRQAIMSQISTSNMQVNDYVKEQFDLLQEAIHAIKCCPYKSAVLAFCRPSGFDNQVNTWDSDRFQKEPHAGDGIELIHRDPKPG